MSEPMTEAGKAAVSGWADPAIVAEIEVEAARAALVAARSKWDMLADWNDAPAYVTAAKEAGDIGTVVRWLLTDAAPVADPQPDEPAPEGV